LDLLVEGDPRSLDPVVGSEGSGVTSRFTAIRGGRDGKPSLTKRAHAVSVLFGILFGRLVLGVVLVLSTCPNNPPNIVENSLGNTSVACGVSAVDI